MGAGTGQTMARITTAWRRAEVVVEAIFFNSKKSQVDEGRKKNRRAALRHTALRACLQSRTGLARAAFRA